ncbi:MAG: MCE family protein [Alphaproteobacteria bacterium]|nr:MCE family protein [Alphaproteobacteria bacterium]
MEIALEEKYSQEETKSIRIGLMALLVILVSVFITISHNSSIKKKNLGGSYRIYASFGRTDGLNLGDPVRMSGVTIGRVVGAQLDENFHSRLIFEVDSKYKIPDDSSASIVSFGLVGGKYVEIEVGGSEEYIKAGQSMEYTQDAMVLEELLERIISMGKANKKQAKSSDQTTDTLANTIVDTVIGDEADE